MPTQENTQPVAGLDRHAGNAYVAVQVVNVGLADEGGERGADASSLHALLHDDDLPGTVK